MWVGGVMSEVCVVNESDVCGECEGWWWVLCLCGRLVQCCLRVEWCGVTSTAACLPLLAACSARRCEWSGCRVSVSSRSYSHTVMCYVSGRPAQSVCVCCFPWLQPLLEPLLAYTYCIVHITVPYSTAYHSTVIPP